MINNSLRKKVLSNSKTLLLGRLLQMTIQLIMGLLIPKLVDPIKYGLWRSLMIIYQYATFSNAGTYAAIGVKMPYLNGTGELDEREKIKNNAFYFNVFVSTTLSIILIISSNFTYGENSIFYKYGFLLFSLLIFTTNIVDFFLQLFRIEKKFSVISFLSVSQILVQLILSIILLLIFENVLLLAVAIIFSNIMIIFLSLSKARLPKFENVNLLEMWNLIIYGFPILLNSILLELIRGIDQILIITFLNPEDLGYYGLAIAIQRIGFLVPGVLASTTMPYLYEEYGKSKDIARISQIYEKSITVVSLICSFLLINMIIYSELLINFFLPKYLPSLIILKILLFGMFSIGLLGLPENLAAITGQVKKIIRWQFVVIAFSTILILSSIKLGYGNSGVALASVFAHLILTIGILFITFNIYITSIKEIILKILLLYLPYLYLIIGYLIIDKLLHINKSTLGVNITLAMIKSFLVFIFFIPVFLFYNKKLKISDVFFKKIFNLNIFNK